MMMLTILASVSASDHSPSTVSPVVIAHDARLCHSTDTVKYHILLSLCLRTIDNEGCVERAL